MERHHIISKRLLELRKQIGLSRRKVQEKHNISANTIKAWESGTTEIGIARLLNYLEIFKQYGINMTIDRLLDPENNHLNRPTVINIDNAELSDFAYPRSQAEIKLISEAIAQTINFITEQKEKMLQSLFDYLPFKIVFKDEHNSILRLNNLAAADLGGNIRDFEGRNTYDLFPKTAKKYHEDDLKVMDSNKPLFNIIENYTPINCTSRIIISTDKIPILDPRTNKKMILVIFRNL